MYQLQEKRSKEHWLQCACIHVHVCVHVCTCIYLTCAQFALHVRILDVTYKNSFASFVDCAYCLGWLALGLHHNHSL